MTQFILDSSSKERLSFSPASDGFIIATLFPTRLFLLNTQKCIYIIYILYMYVKFNIMLNLALKDTPHILMQHNVEFI